jgi:hypothetical protein
VKETFETVAVNVEHATDLGRIREETIAEIEGERTKSRVVDNLY